MKWSELKKVVNALTVKQLKEEVFVTDGCDDNGNAVFIDLVGVTFVGDGVIDSAADLLLESRQAVLLMSPVEVEEDEE